MNFVCSFVLLLGALHASCAKTAPRNRNYEAPIRREKESASLSVQTRGSNGVLPGSVNAESCGAMTPSHLELDQDENGAILAEVGPETDLSADEPTLAFLYAKSLVRNRAAFFSLTLQMLNGSEDRDTVYLGRKRLDEFEQQPGFFYHYMSAATALVAGPSSMAASGLFFDTHTHYPNWHQNAGFNSTLPLFAPRAVHLQESVGVLDYGADASLNYTSRDVYKTNDWFEDWGFPDNRYGILKQVYAVQVEDRRVAFYGAASNDAVHVSPVYYDCGRTNRWLLGVSSPVVEVLPRYCAYQHLHLDVEALLSDVPSRSSGSPSMLEFLPSDEMDCQNVPPTTLADSLPESFFRSLYPQSRLALRMAHFLSAFLQTRDPSGWDAAVEAAWDDYHKVVQQYVDARQFDQIPPPPGWVNVKMDKYPSDKVLSAEAVANVLADDRIMGSGIFFDVDRSAAGDSSQPKALFAWRDKDSHSDVNARVADLSQHPGGDSYLQALLMRVLRTDWGDLSSANGLKTHYIDPKIRSRVRYAGGLDDFGPVSRLEYKAELRTNYWTVPYYKCDGRVDEWVMTYAAPFFGPSEHPDGGQSLVFKGIVTVDVKVSADNLNV
ncbi:hypothetical protein BaRGS_00008696 [Batillaria attramentaria]|uniref:Uncharacterized protein n=1 Tax=Batillaria attramentaria TaxID=370345 RepID=A0ABD0LKT9_9CAEN